MAILKQVEPVLESAIKTLSQVIDLKGMMPKQKPKEPELPPLPKEEDPTNQVDLASLLKAAMGQKAAKKEPEPASEEEAAGGELEGLDLSQLGFMQLSSQMNFDKNSAHGKDADGFDEQIFLQEQDDIKS